MNRKIGYYVSKAHEYATKVMGGEILACEYVVLACERYMRDLSHEDTKDFPYYYDQAEAERCCSFFEALPHVKGKLAGLNQTIELEPWQCFLMCNIYGWRKSGTKNRRFRTAYVEIPRKNGKSPMGSGVALLGLSFDNEYGAEVYTAASKKDQAEICFGDARAMLEKDSEFCDYFGIEYNTRAIYVKQTNSSIKALAKDQRGTLDGLNIHCSVIDELHAHKDAATWNVIASGVAAREQPLVFAITTAGFDRGGICYDKHMYTIKLLQNVFTDESFFGIIYTIDKKDDWRDQSSWEKANPNYGVSVNKEYIEAACKEAQNSPSNLNNFLTKHLNVWCSSDAAWIDMLKFDECADPSMTEKECIEKGMDLFVAVDMASKKDFCAISKVYLGSVDGYKNYYVFTEQFINDDALEKSTIESLKGWAHEGYIKTNRGETTDFNNIENRIKEIAKLKPKYIAFDAYQAAQIMQNLKDAGIKNVVEYGQHIKNMSEPMKEFEAAVLDKRFHYTGDPVFNWMVSNVIAYQNAEGNIKPTRNKNAKFDKIDSAVATIMAIGLTIKEKPRERTYGVY